MSIPFSPVTCRDKKHYDSYYQDCEQEVPVEYISDYFLVNPQPPGLINEINRKLYVIEYSEIIGAPLSKVKAYMLIESIYLNAYMKQLSSKLCLCQKGSTVGISPKIIDHYYCTGFSYNSAVITYEYFEYVSLENYIKDYVAFFSNRNLETLSSSLTKEERKKSLEIFFVLLSLYKTILLFSIFLKFDVALTSSFFMIRKTKSGDFDGIFLNIIYDTTMSPKIEGMMFDVTKEFEKIKGFINSVVLGPFFSFFKFVKSNYFKHVKKCIEEFIEEEDIRLKNNALHFQFSDIYKTKNKPKIISFIDTQLKIVATNLANNLIKKEKIKVTPEIIYQYLSKFNVGSTDLHIFDLSEEIIHDSTLSKYEIYNFPNCGYHYTTKSSIRESGLNKKDIERWKENNLYYVLDDKIYQKDLPNPKQLNEDQNFIIYVDKKIKDTSKQKKYIVFIYLPSQLQKKYFLLDEVNYENSTKEYAKDYLQILVLLGYYNICPKVYNNYICTQILSSTVSRITLSAYHPASLPIEYFLLTIFQKNDTLPNKILTIVSLFHCLIMQYLFLFSVLGLDYEGEWVKKIQINTLNDSDISYFHFDEYYGVSSKKRHAIQYPTDGLGRIKKYNPVFIKKPTSIDYGITKYATYFAAMIDKVFTLEYLTFDDIRKNVYLFQISKKYINDYIWHFENGKISKYPNDTKNYILQLSKTWNKNLSAILSKLATNKQNPSINKLWFAFQSIITNDTVQFTNKILNQYDESMKLNFFP